VLSREDFGRSPCGAGVSRWTLSGGGLKARVLTYGATLQELWVTDRDGVPGNVTLGLPTVDAYAAHDAYLGAVVGRYANRIAGGHFVLDGEEFRLPVNDRGNTLHGGPVGFDRKVWAATEVPGGLRLSLHSPHGDMGFPGALTMTVTYTLDSFGLTLDFRAVCDRPTVLNPTHHAYWNLAGGGTVDGHLLTVDADSYIPVDDTGIPLAGLEPVSDSSFDLREPTKLTSAFDHCFALNGGVRLSDPLSGRQLTVTTSEPGVQVYTADALNVPGFEPRSGVCLETQNFPDAPNRSAFPSAVLRPGVEFSSTTRLRFTSEA
jgi:aldose 1-epimerase